VPRLQARLDEAEGALREQRRTHREALDALKAEVTTLRRTLGETRSRDRTALEAAEAARTEAEGAASRLERELRQARGQVARLEEQAAVLKRQTRDGRDEASMRARLLVETLVDAAAGLRRELALAPTEATPADRVAATLTSPEGAREPTSTGSLERGSPALLEAYLALPRPHLVVDGYNVTKAAWPSLSLEAQRIRLLAVLAPLVARTGTETTVVFDAAASQARPVVTTPRGVRVLFSPYGVIADDVIRELVAAEPGGRVVVVATEDRAVADDVRRAGARVVSGRALV
jgi:hypothetical protein